MSATAATPTVIRSGRRALRVGRRELWAHRELLYFLVWRDAKVRYKQTVLGALWAVVQPLMTMVVFAIFFGKLAGVPSDGRPYSLFAFTALVPWTYFATPVAYPASLVPPDWRPLYGLNPMATVVEGFRWTLLGTAPPSSMAPVSCLVVVLALGLGLVYFRRVEGTFADVL
jgi:ABC-type polysaccharide/polyol phosphate export permease